MKGRTNLNREKRQCTARARTVRNEPSNHLGSHGGPIIRSSFRKERRNYVEIEQENETAVDKKAHVRGIHLLPVGPRQSMSWRNQDLLRSMDVKALPTDWPASDLMEEWISYKPEPEPEVRPDSDEYKSL